MGLVFTTSPSTLNTLTGDINNSTSINLATLSETYRSNGTYTIAIPDGYDGIGDSSITVNVPTTLDNQEKSATYTANGTYAITPDASKSGLSKANITVNVQPNLQEKSTSNLVDVILPDADKDGLSKVTVNVPVEQRSATITANGTYSYEPSADAKAMTKVNLTVDVDPELEEKSITVNGTYTPSTGKDGFSKVIVDVEGAAELEEKTITENGTYLPSTGKDGFSKVVVNVEDPDVNYYVASYLFSTEVNGEAVIIPQKIPGYDVTYLDKVIVKTDVKPLNETKAIQTNGIYTPSAGYTGFDKVIVQVDDSQLMLQEKEVTYTQPGEYSVLPTQGEYNGLSKVDVTVDIANVKVTELAANGERMGAATTVAMNRFTGGTFTTADGRTFKIEW